MNTWKGQAFEREWHRAMAEWIDGGRVGSVPVWEVIHPETQKLWVKGEGNIPAFWFENLYRWKPKPKRTVTINGKVLVAPEVDAPADRDVYWYVTALSIASQANWIALPSEKLKLSAGNVFLTREDAQAMADWLVKCRRGET